jgi:hypothetical protein
MRRERERHGRVGVLEKDGVVAERVDRRRLHVFVPIGGQMIGAERVDGDEDDRRMLVVRARGAAATRGQHEESRGDEAERAASRSPRRGGSTTIAPQVRLPDPRIIRCTIPLRDDAPGRQTSAAGHRCRRSPGGHEAECTAPRSSRLRRPTEVAPTVREPDPRIIRHTIPLSDDAPGRQTPATVHHCRRSSCQPAETGREAERPASR